MKRLAQLLIVFVLSLGFFSFSHTDAFADVANTVTDFRASSGSTNTVNLYWIGKDPNESYNIAYGTAPGSYQYGVTNIGKVEQYTIGGLTAGQKYYFVLSPIQYGKALAFTYEVSAVAGGSTSQTTATTPTTTQTMNTTPSAEPVTATPVQSSTQTSSVTYESAPQMAVNEDKNFHLTAVPGPMKGTVTLMWDNKGYTDNYNIAYGPSAGQYIWGAAQVGHIGQFTIGALTSGQRYYFVLSAVDDKTAMPYTPYVSFIAP